MGRDVRIISNHNIDTSSNRKIAEQLAQAWHTNISLSYMDNCTKPGTVFKGTFEIHELCHVDIGAERTVLLLDNMYCDSIIEPDKHRGMVYLETLDSKDHDTELPEEGDLGATTWWPGIYYPNRWWYFIREFCEGYEHSENFYYLNKFRRQVKSSVEKLGGTQAMYFDDQSESAYTIATTPDELNIPWHQLLEKVRSEKGVEFINVSQWMRAGEKQYLLPYTNYIFFDDFADLLDSGE